uniref:Uncharacterized protein n=1 Tax=Zea mays TaxID=4577 RepID=A0A804RHX3_MAIZE
MARLQVEEGQGGYGQSKPREHIRWRRGREATDKAVVGDKGARRVPANSEIGHLISEMSSHVHNICAVLNERTKYNNMEPDAVDFFGECMNSPQNGRTPLANEIYEQMVAEKERELEEGEAQKSPSKIVADSLSQISRSSTFLPNIGVPTMSKTGRSTSLAAQAHMQAQFEEKLQAEREEAARKQEELQAQLQAQQAALEENQSLLRQTQEEVKGMHTKFEETNALVRAILKLQKD